MLYLKPSQQLKVRHIKQGITATAILLESKENELLLELKSDLALQWGDELELEFVKDQDALYRINARVLKAGPERTCTLKVLGEPYRLQRRRSKRIPTRLQAQYLTQSEEAEYRQGLILDISRGGVLFSVEEPLNLSSRLVLFFEFFSGEEDDALTTKMSGKIIRQHTSPQEYAYSHTHSYGIEFDRPFTQLAG